MKKLFIQISVLTSLLLLPVIGAVAGLPKDQQRAFLYVHNHTGEKMVVIKYLPVWGDKLKFESITYRNQYAPGSYLAPGGTAKWEVFAQSAGPTIKAPHIAYWVSYYVKWKGGSPIKSICTLGVHKVKGKSATVWKKHTSCADNKMKATVDIQGDAVHFKVEKVK